MEGICDKESKGDWPPKNLVKLAPEDCRFCGKTIREQYQGCNEITCYRQFLPKGDSMNPEIDN